MKQNNDSTLYLYVHHVFTSRVVPCWATECTCTLCVTGIASDFVRKLVNATSTETATYHTLYLNMYRPVYSIAKNFHDFHQCPPSNMDVYLRYYHYLVRNNALAT